MYILPSLLNEGAMDPNILKHYVLIQNNEDGPAEANKIWRKIRRRMELNAREI